MSYPDGLYPGVDDETWWIARGHKWPFVVSGWTILTHRASKTMFKSLIGPYWTKEEAQRILDKWL